MIPLFILLSFLSISLAISAAEYGEQLSEETHLGNAYQDFEQQEVERNDPHVETPSPGSADAPANWTILPSEIPQETPFRGNWFKKRALLQEMRVSQEALHKMVQDVWIPHHQTFKDTYQPALQQMKELQQSLGFSQETITEISTALSNLSATTTGTQVSAHIIPSATFNQDAVIHLLNEMRESLHILDEICNNATKAFQQAEQQEPMGLQFDQEAWKFYEEIDAAYDDYQAERLYKNIQSSEEYLKKLHTYLINELAPYFNYLVGQCDATSKRIETIYNALAKQGVILRTSDIPAPKPVVPNPNPQPSWWQRILEWILAPFYFIGRWLKLIKT